jgi:hypothetical protein
MLEAHWWKKYCSSGERTLFNSRLSMSKTPVEGKSIQGLRILSETIFYQGGIE